MKKLLLTVLFSCLFQFSANAFVYAPQISFGPSNTYAQASVYNSWNRPMVCSGQVNFVTSRGRYVYAYFANQLIYPGQYAYAYAYSNIYEPLAFGNSSVHCRF